MALKLHKLKKFSHRNFGHIINPLSRKQLCCLKKERLYALFLALTSDEADKLGKGVFSNNGVGNKPDIFADLSAMCGPFGGKLSLDVSADDGKVGLEVIRVTSLGSSFALDDDGGGSDRDDLNMTVQFQLQVNVEVQADTGGSQEEGALTMESVRAGVDEDQKVDGGITAEFHLRELKISLDNQGNDVDGESINKAVQVLDESSEEIEGSFGIDGFKHEVKIVKLGGPVEFGQQSVDIAAVSHGVSADSHIQRRWDGHGTSQAGKKHNKEFHDESGRRN